jgi:general secretion pathway protein C
VLDTFFRRYFWAFHVVVIVLAATLCARLVNAVVDHALRPSAKVLLDSRAGSARPMPEPGSDEPDRIVSLLEKNVFRAAREDLSAKAEQSEDDEANQEAIDPNACERSRLPVNLVATFSAEGPENSVAVFFDPGAEETSALRIGEKLQDTAEIVEITPREVLSRNGGRCESFSLEDPESALVAQNPGFVAPNPGDGSDIGQGIKKTANDEYEIPRAEVDKVLSNLNSIATQARIVPSFFQGKANGFKLFSIRPDSLYSKIGIQNGDVIQRINGFEMNSPDKALEIYSKLKNADSISVDVLRGGGKKSMSYNIR